MASIHSFPKALIDDTLLYPPPIETAAAAAAHKKLLQQPSPNVLPLLISRRDALLISVLPFNLAALSLPSQARERRGRKAISPEEYMTSPDGLKYYDITEGKGPKAEKGSTVQPYEFTVGSPPGKERKREFVDNANGLYSAQAAPKPPPAMYSITEGMKVGGKRVVIVPPEAGYGKKGMNEIPPGATFELDVELLRVMPPNGK
ncbi:peptidyl-prolyl cis-trans isomerase FKBP18, chloroplastic isoform X3 [Phoenix dactylifera]|uniref:peptidylprolyl isomerase n=1 Tax=Phoenix dactylifera TaxID=42345 RepID=A0A8B8ZCG8_PHODC|nr:peptidyl-prolyl cis-trans isomerase FKBP18, chloroplastic isoform X3 [Phoenix dactylifera]